MSNNGTSEKYNELDLIVLAQEGNNSAFDLLTNKYYTNIFNHLLIMTRNRLDAEDITQETFLKAYQKLGSYIDNNFKSWLMKIAVNNFINHYHKNQLPKKNGIDIVEYLDEYDYRNSNNYNEVSDEFRKNEIGEMIIKKAGPIYGPIVILCDIKELEYQEIAEEKNMVLGTVMSELFRGRKLLRKNWEFLREIDGEAYIEKYLNK